MLEGPLARLLPALPSSVQVSQELCLSFLGLRIEPQTTSLQTFLRLQSKHSNGQMLFLRELKVFGWLFRAEEAGEGF